MLTTNTDKSLQKVRELTRELLEKDRRLDDAEKRFKGAFEHASIGMALVAPDGKFIKVNNSLARMLDYSVAELESMDYQSITHPVDLAEDESLLKEILDGKREWYRLEKRYISKKDKVVEILLSVSCVRDNYNEASYFVSQVMPLSSLRGNNGPYKI